MRKYLFLLFLLIATNAYAGGQQTLVTPDGRVLGTASNPLVVTGGGSISGLTGDSTSTVLVTEQGYFDLVYNFDGASTYTNNTTESKTTFGTAFNILSSSSQYLYLGKSTTFDDVSVTVRTMTTATVAITAEYWNGSAWTSLSITDNTNNFQNNGTITYTVPGSWEQTAVNSQTYYWIRISSGSSFSTTPSIYAIRPGSNKAFSVYSSYSDTTPALSVGNDGKVSQNGVPMSNSVTYTVGTVTSRNGRNADFVCTGAKDQVCINKAITACSAANCKIQLMEGTYTINSSIGITSGTGVALVENLEIAGMGIGRTKIVSSNGTYSTFSDVTNPTTGNPLDNFILHDLEIDRSADTKDASVTRKGLFIKYMTKVHVYNTYMHDSGATCIGIDFLQGSWIHHNYLENCGTSSATTGSSGIGIGTSEYTNEPNIITNNIITGSGYAGVLIEHQAGAAAGLSNNFVIANNILTGGPQYGIVIDKASHVTITGNVIRSNTKDGIIVKGSSPNDVTITGNDITTNTLYGLRVSSTGATNIHVSNNNMTGNGTAAILNSITSSLELTRLNNLGDTESFLENSFRIIAPTAQTIAAGNTVASDGCGTVKRITSAGAVTTDTTNTFTAPGDANNGCCMDVVNNGANNITLDTNALFVSFGGFDVVLTANDAVRVCSDGSKWYQTGLLVAN